MASTEQKLTVDVVGMESVVSCITILGEACGAAIAFVERERQAYLDYVSLGDGTVPDAADRAFLAEFDVVLAKLRQGVAAAEAALKRKPEEAAASC